MIEPVSRPVIPEQPGTEFYGTQDLALFKTYSRDSYQAAFGVQPPGYDPSRLRKTWFDSTVDVSDPGNVAVYRVVAQDPNGNGALRQMVMPAWEAATVNLPGVVSYPAYSVPPTRATRGGGVLNAIYFSSEADAQTVMAEMGGTGLFLEQMDGFPVTYPPDEPRRLWSFLFKGNPVNVGALLLDRNGKGVGSPGHWDLSGSVPLWVPDPPGPTGADDTRPLRDMPVRDLLPNEHLYAGMMGILGVVRTDLQKTADEASGMFTHDDRAMLRMIYQAVSKPSS